MKRLTVTDPGYKGRILAVHEGLDGVTLRELKRIYRALRYPERCLKVEADEFEEVA
jgi:hypothetical protein